MSRLRMGVVADDVTGANDIGSMLVKSGYETHVYPRQNYGGYATACGAAMDPDICILDTNSRLDAPAEAYAKVFAATEALQAMGCRQFYNKTCSVFRGNIGAEFDAMLDALGKEFAVVVLAFPKNGRTTVRGIHYVHGKPLAESEFRNDPAHPMNESDLVSILQAQTKRRVGRIDIDVVRRGTRGLRQAIEALRGAIDYVILDAVTQEDVRIAAHAVHDVQVLCGSSALAEELPHAWPTPAAVRSSHAAHLKASTAGIICAAGSLMPQTKAQIGHLSSLGIPVYELSTVNLLEANCDDMLASLSEALASALLSGKDALFHVSPETDVLRKTRAHGLKIGLTPVEIARTVTSGIAEVVKRVLDRTHANRLIVAGGETSAAVMDRLGIEGIRICREIEPGLPSCVSLNAPLRALVLKSGSFGSPSFLKEAIDHLKGEE